MSKLIKRMFTAMAAASFSGGLLTIVLLSPGVA